MVNPADPDNPMESAATPQHEDRQAEGGREEKAAAGQSITPEKSQAMIYSPNDEVELPTDGGSESNSGAVGG